MLNLSFFQLNLFLDRQLRNGFEVAFETHYTFFKIEFIILSVNVYETFKFSNMALLVVHDTKNRQKLKS